MDIKNQKISDRIWRGKITGLLKSLWDREREYASQKDDKKLSPLISIHYTLHEYPVIGRFCKKRMIVLSNLFENAVGGLESMSSHALLVQTRVRFAEKNFWKAFNTALLVFERNDVSPDNRALALIALSEAQSAKYGPSVIQTVVFSWYKEALNLSKDPKYRVRVLRSYAEFLKLRGEGSAWNAIKEAEELAEANNLGDQLRKIRKLKRKIEKGQHLR